MNERYALITGASTGMGRATALRLAADGYSVFACVRKMADGRALADAKPAAGEVIPVLLDVTDAGQIASAVAAVAERAGDAGLSVLVNNAGVGVFGPVELAPLETVRWQFEVNVTGQIAVTQAFLPLLRRRGGRLPLALAFGRRLMQDLRHRGQLPRCPLLTDWD